MNAKKKLCISFSGGRTSAYMAWWCKKNLSHEYEIRCVFANTGQEHENTLRFIDQCDRAFGLSVEWIEAVVNPEQGEGTRHKVVSFETASRDGTPFEDMIRKYGIPNQAYPHCTRELKLMPIKDWQRVNGWTDCLMSVGIRADEVDRMQPDAKSNGLVYPLISMSRMTKSSVIDWWSRQSFDLEVPERLGNCVWCWKKSVRKHLTNIVDVPDAYDFPRRMEAKYPTAGHNETGEARVFFRKHTSTNDLFAMAEKGFVPFIESTQHQIDWIDEAGWCSESCEVVFS